MEILVVGAGVGGLAAARGLSAAGHRVRVFEKAPALRTGGSAVTMWSNGSGILAELGVPLEDAGSRIDVLEQHDFTGRPLMRIDVSRAARRYGHPHLCLPRGHLIRRLSDGLPDGTLFFGRACTAIAHDENGVHVEFADGSRATGDLLVGADGHRSVVRRHLWGEDPTRPTGWTTWQGLLPRPTADVAGGVCRMLIGPEGTCGLMRAGEGLLQWWFDMPWQPADALPASPADVLRRRFGHWAPPVPDVLAAIRDEDVEFFPHHGHRVPRIWGEGRCTLVGDAAHTMPPSQAQGANQALEDAWALIRALRNPAELPSALRRYEHRRSVKSARVARAANLEATNVYRPFLNSLVPTGLASMLYTRWLRAISDYLTDAPSLSSRGGRLESVSSGSADDLLIDHRAG